MALIDGQRQLVLSGLRVPMVGDRAYRVVRVEVVVQ